MKFPVVVWSPESKRFWKAYSPLDQETKELPEVKPTRKKKATKKQLAALAAHFK